MGREAAQEVAREIENDSRSQECASIREIILLHPLTRVLMVAEAVRGIGATVQCWNAKKQAYEEKPDPATSYKWVSWLAGYSDGLPVATNLNLNATTPSSMPVQPDEMLARSPAMRDAVRRMLDQSDKAAAKTKEKMAAVPV
jgi:hypothetical protein